MLFSNLVWCFGCKIVTSSELPKGEAEVAITIISGGRHHRDPNIVDAAVRASGYVVTAVIEGGQRTRDAETREIVGGVDYFARLWAEARGIPVETMEADWGRYRKLAGPIRNEAMAMVGEQLIAIPDEESHGTWDMVRKAKKRGLPVFVFRG